MIFQGYKITEPYLIRHQIDGKETLQTNLKFYLKRYYDPEKYDKMWGLKNEF